MNLTHVTRNKKNIKKLLKYEEKIIILLISSKNDAVRYAFVFS